MSTSAPGLVELGSISVPNPKPWSTTTPNLHLVSVTVNNATVIERFGLRVFGVDKDSSRITLNNEVVKLVGYNHHTQYVNLNDHGRKINPTWVTPVGTDDQLKQDIALLLQGGTNYVRGAHYPQDPRWLDLLDEAGIVMWCETLGPNVGIKDIQIEYFMKYQLEQLEQMLDNALNHASIMTWGWFNEGPSNNKDACTGYAQNNDYVHSRDPTRFTTYASNMHRSDVCWEHADMISMNVYPSWYDSEDPRDEWTALGAAVRGGTTDSKEHTLGKPLVVSETGAGGIYEWSDNTTDAKWTLNFQTEIISEDVKTILGDDNFSGITIWHLFDFKVDDKEENNTHCEYEPDVYPPICGWIDPESNRPAGYNHKGVLDFWRRPKPIFQIVASMYNASRS